MGGKFQSLPPFTTSLVKKNPQFLAYKGFSKVFKYWNYSNCNLLKKRIKMKIEDLLWCEGKNIKILLKNKFIYTCKISEFLGDCIKVVDKFDKEILISLDEISVVSEVGVV